MHFHADNSLNLNALDWFMVA